MRRYYQITGTKWTSKENVYCSPTLAALSWRAAGRRGVSGLALLTFTPRGAGKDSASSSLLGFKFHGFLLSRFDPNVPMGQRTPVPNGRGTGGMETLQRGHVQAWQLRAVGISPRWGARRPQGSWRLGGEQLQAWQFGAGYRTHTETRLPGG